MTPPEQEGHKKEYRKKKYQHLTEFEYLVIKCEQLKRKRMSMEKGVRIMLAIPIMLIIFFGLVVPLLYISISQNRSTGSIIQKDAATEPQK